MSKMSKLDSILKEAEEHAQALVSCINEIREQYSGANEVAPKKESKPTPGPEEKPPTLEEVRAYLAELARNGHTKEIQAMLLRHGHKKISEVPATEYEVLVPAARQAWNGEGDFKAGEHCRFCKVRTTCRKRAEYNLELARYDFEPPSTLDDIEIAAILAKADELVSWVTDVKEYALRQALSGVTYDGFKVVEGRSNRKYTDENAVVEAVKAAGFDPYEHSVLGITAMTALLGKKKFNELLGGLIEKPQGKAVYGGLHGNFNF